MSITCKSFLVMNSVIYACKKTGAHTHLHMNEPSMTSTALGWGSRAPNVVHSPVGSRFVATRGTNGSGFEFMGIRDTVNTEEWAEGPFEYRNSEEFMELKSEAAQMQTEWDNKIKLLQAEAINTDDFFVSVQLVREHISLRPSQYTNLFDRELVESDFDVANRAMITYHIPNVPIYDGKTANDLHDEFCKRIAHKLEEINHKAAAELVDA